jgi:hypothetical protein
MRSASVAATSTLAAAAALPHTALPLPPKPQESCLIAHTPFKYPGSGGGSLRARWVGTHQHLAIPNFDSEIGYRLLDF